LRDRISGIFTKKKQGHVASKARTDTRFAKRVCNAKGRVPSACPEDVDVAASPGFDRRQILSLAKGKPISRVRIVRELPKRLSGLSEICSINGPL